MQKKKHVQSNRDLRFTKWRNNTNEQKEALSKTLEVAYLSLQFPMFLNSKPTKRIKSKETNHKEKSQGQNPRVSKIDSKNTQRGKITNVLKVVSQQLKDKKNVSE